MQLCTAKGSPEAQLVGVVTVCEELQQLLKCAFIGGLGLYVYILHERRAACLFHNYSYHAFIRIICSTPYISLYMTGLAVNTVYSTHTENGLLASRIEILTRYHMESMKKYG